MVRSASQSRTEAISAVTTFERLLAEWDGEEVVFRFDQPSGAWMFICIHSTLLGPAEGGTRMHVYDSPAEAMADAMRLASAMTSKLAVAGLPFGGGKGVIAVSRIPRGRERQRLMHSYAAMLNSLRGLFRTAPDMNTTELEMDLISEVSPHVSGLSRARGGWGSGSPGTSKGVLYGIRAALTHVCGSPNVAGRAVLIQGAGEIGAALAELLAQHEANVLVSDVLEGRALALADRIGARVIPPEEVIGTACDVFAPCAVGGILNRKTIPRLRCRIVAGAANNQLAKDEDAELMRAAGILYAPDYVVNAGGAIYSLGLEVMDWSKAEVDGRLEAVGHTLARLFAQSEAESISTEAAAARLVREQLRVARQEATFNGETQRR
jgi:leucine dehydrogenase